MVKLPWINQTKQSYVKKKNQTENEIYLIKENWKKTYNRNIFPVEPITWYDQYL